jgi:hypothetical protein
MGNRSTCSVGSSNRPTSTRGHFRAGPFQTAHSGTLHIQFQLSQRRFAQHNHGVRSIFHCKRWRWDVNFIASGPNPMNMCFGCIDAVPSTSIRPWLRTRGEALGGVGGNSISHPVLY